MNSVTENTKHLVRKLREIGLEQRNREPEDAESEGDRKQRSFFLRVSIFFLEEIVATDKTSSGIVSRIVRLIKIIALLIPPKIAIWRKTNFHLAGRKSELVQSKYVKSKSRRSR